MFAADHASIDDIEVSVENRLGKSLAPRTAAAQDARGLHAQFGVLQFAVRVDDAGERFGVGTRGDFGGESRSKSIEIRFRERHARGHRVPAKFADEAWVPRGDTVQRVADV